MIRELGRGSFGVVYLCEKDGAQYAVKSYEPSPAVQAAITAGQVKDSELRQRFSGEAKYQAHINNPNVVKVVDADMNANPPYFAMNLAECSLSDELKQDATIGGQPEKALFDILAGLEAIHSQGIYHRDLKPANVLKIRNSDGSFRYAISDFGLMKSTLGDSTTLTATGAQGGTQRYAAPELMINFKRATVRSDIFSFGVILQDLFAPNAARVPYTEVQIGGAIGKVASKCTKAVAIRRYGSVGELRAALYEALQAEPLTFGSTGEQNACALLEADIELAEQQWDQIFTLLEDEDIAAKSRQQILRLFTKDHLVWLASNAPDLLAAYGGYFCEYLDSSEGNLNFDYCDVAADKLGWLFDLGDVAQKARTLISLMIMGASHNRWYVERKFFSLAGSQLPVAVANRVLTDIDVRGIQAMKHIEHIELSINEKRQVLCPILHQLWTNDAL